MKSSVSLQILDMDELTEFRNIINSFSEDMYLIKGNYKCDAKSLMGILAIDLSSPTILEFDNSLMNEVLTKLNKFIIPD